MSTAESSDPRWIQFEGKIYRVPEGQTALDAMLRGGANVTFSCRKGTCRSCMLEAVSGDPGPEARARLPEELQELGFFLPCMTSNPRLVEAKLPDLAKWVTGAVIAEKTRLSDSVYKFLLEAERNIDWRAGQFVTLRGPDGEARSYSIASLPSDYYIELHIRHYPDGKVSDWLVSSMEVGDRVEFNGPSGVVYYAQDMIDRPLLLLGTGTGLAPLIGVVRDALLAGHDAPITLYHGATTEDGLYMRKDLEALAEQHGNLTVHCVASRENGGRRITDMAFSPGRSLSDHTVIVCGAPDMVEAARVAALAHGAELDHLHSDPFEMPVPYKPDDEAKVASVPPDPELWEALQGGPLLTEILTEFYGRVFADPRLSPFFHRVTKQRLIEKQYAFTADLLTGRRDYFGELPFNAHHWMLISDELFDYREKLFFSVVRMFGFPEHLIPRWAALNEMFRREIVKSQIRGVILDGVERIRESYVEETLVVASLCDGCGNEMALGDKGYLHARTGELFCGTCHE